jgi:hypothetical protein
MTVHRRAGLVKWRNPSGGTSHPPTGTLGPARGPLAQQTAPNRVRSTPSAAGGTTAGAASAAVPLTAGRVATTPRKRPIPGGKRLKQDKESNPMSKRQPRDIVCPRCGVPSAKVIGRSESQPVIYLRCDDCGRTSIAPE